MLALVCSCFLPARLEALPGLLGRVELKAGAKMKGFICFDRDHLVLRDGSGAEHRIQAGDLKVAYLDGGDVAPLPGLLATCYRQSGLAGPSVERVDGVIDFDSGAMPAFPDGGQDKLSVRWDGEIETASAGNYLFQVNGNGGVRLWVNARKLIDQWNNRQFREHVGNIQLEGRQRYSIRLECIECDGNDPFRLLWTKPGEEDRQLISAEHLSHQIVKTSQPNGLLGRYHKGSNFKGDPVERIDREIDFDWTGKAPFPGYGINYFSVRWEGEVQAPVSGPVTFHATTDDGVRVWVGGELIIDEWRPRLATESRGNVNLLAGRRYPFRMDYYQATKGASAKLSWSAPGLNKELVPSKLLFANSATRPAREVSPGILLKGGSFLAGKLSGMDQREVRLSYLDKRELKIRRENAGALQFVPLITSELDRIAVRRPGSALRDGDYLVSRPVSLAEGKIEVISSIFGLRELKTDQVKFVKLQDFGTKKANFEVRTKSGSLLRADWLMVDDQRALVKDNSFCWINLEPADITAVYGIAVGRD